MPQSAMQLSNISHGPLAGHPVSYRLATPGRQPLLARRRERESPSHDSALLAGYQAPWPFVSDGSMVHLCMVEEKKIARVSVDR